MSDAVAVHAVKAGAAHLAALMPSRKIETRIGLFGDLLGNVERLPEHALGAAVVPLEWSDLDPRLGFRSLGGWRPSALADILATVSDRLDRLRQSLATAAATVPVGLALPTLPMPPIAHTPGWYSSDFELELHARLARFSADAARSDGVRIVNRARLDRVSPFAGRFDAKSELLSGFPYAIEHASALGEALARLIAPWSPKKGLITDLDDTVWRGILGEVGVGGVHWNLDGHSQGHGLYQQLLASLAEAGVLVAAASKNDPALVEEAFGRRDLALDVSKVFPREVHWQSKAGSVARILDAWNIGADSVVFVDDSPMELAEVKAAFPEVECLAFPTHDDRAIVELLGTLRDLFGKPRLSREDSLRIESLKSAFEAKREAIAAGPNADPDALLESARPVLAFSFEKTPADPRALELVNKTNQFNLNGRRYAAAEWRAALDDPATFLIRVSYEDKFGPLGTIAVLGGRTVDRTARLDFWVMSCRAFSRRIEHRTIQEVFERLNVEDIVFDYQETPRNGPTRDALKGASGVEPANGLRLDRSTFDRNRPSMPHTIANWTNA